jgi:hypothetical protein
LFETTEGSDDLPGTKRSTRTERPAGNYNETVECPPNYPQKKIDEFFEFAVEEQMIRKARS